MIINLILEGLDMASVDEELTGPEITNDPVTVHTVSAAGETDPEAGIPVAVDQAEIRLGF